MELRTTRWAQGRERTVGLLRPRRRVSLSLWHPPLVADAAVVAVHKRIAEVEALVLLELRLITGEQAGDSARHPGQTVRPEDADRPVRVGAPVGKCSRPTATDRRDHRSACTQRGRGCSAN